MKSLFTLVFTFFLFMFATGQRTEADIYNQVRQNIEKYRKADFNLQITGVKPEDLKNLTIDAEQTSHDFLFGCIIFDLADKNGRLQNEALFRERFKHLFNFAVLPFYWVGYEPVKGKTRQKQNSEVAAWCLENNITCKGHPLAWTNSYATPRWLADYSYDETTRILQKRIEDIVGGFKDQIRIWDVVNEPVNTVTWATAMADRTYSDNSRYGHPAPLEVIAGYVDSCFRWAYKANPDGHFILNEYNLEADNGVRKRFYDLVTLLQQKNTPVKGLGIQAHEPFAGRYYYSPEQVWSTFETFSKFNLPLHITELIQVGNGEPIQGIYKQGTWTEEKQAEYAKMMYTLAFGHPSVVSVNWWGLWDGNIWQPKGGLVDENFNPKPIYNTLDSLINKAWKTSLRNLKPDNHGKVDFRGFKGDYKVIIRRNGEVIKTAPLKFKDLTSRDGVIKCMINLNQ